MAAIRKYDPLGVIGQALRRPSAPTKNSKEKAIPKSQDWEQKMEVSLQHNRELEVRY
jgi:hypothetical protein